MIMLRVTWSYCPELFMLLHYTPGSRTRANFILYLQLRKYQQSSSSFVPPDISHTAILPYEIYII